MGYALWVEGETAWAQGTHEYKPMGVAVIASTQLFRARDFERRRRAPSRRHESFRGLFASIEEVNRHLRESRSREFSDQARAGKLRILSII